MQHRLTLSFLSLVLGLFLFACGSEGPVETGDPANLIVINGDEFQETSIVFADSAGSVVYDTITGVTTVEIEGRLHTAKTVAGDEREVILMIRFPGRNTGTFDWRLIEKDLGGKMVILTIGDEDYYQEEGTLTITAYGNVGERVEGSFSGRLRNASGSAELQLTRGSFSVLRGKDVGEDDAVLAFIINGGEFTNAAIRLEKETGPIGWARYNTDGGAHLDCTIPSGNIDVPGHGTHSFTFVFSFRGSYESVWPWNLVEHTDFRVNIDGEMYTGVEGRTGVSYYGQSFFTPVIGYFSGTLRSVESGELIEIRSGRFATVRFN